MSAPSFTTEFAVEQAPDHVYAAINHVRGWWSGEIDGDTHHLGAEFSYRYPDVHYSKQRIVELVPGKAIEWLVVESDLAHADPRTEWTGTKIRFEIARTGDKTRVRFTHSGLQSELACYDSCSSAWSTLVRGNLRKLITTGTDQPDAFAS